METWKTIDGYDGIYEVSDKGRVRNKKRNKMLRLCKHKTGYVSVMLYKNGECKRVAVHRLVAKAFLPNKHGFEFVNHIDERKDNNAWDNLEWCSREYNMSFGSVKKRISAKRGHSARNKRSVKQMDMRGNDIAIWESIALAAKRTGTARTSIYECCNGIHKTAGGYVWAYM